VGTWGLAGWRSRLSFERRSPRRTARRVVAPERSPSPEGANLLGSPSSQGRLSREDLAQSLSLGPSSGLGTPAAGSVTGRATSSLPPTRASSPVVSVVNDQAGLSVGGAETLAPSSVPYSGQHSSHLAGIGRVYDLVNSLAQSPLVARYMREMASAARESVPPGRSQAGDVSARGASEVSSESAGRSQVGVVSARGASEVSSESAGRFQAGDVSARGASEVSSESAGRSQAGVVNGISEFPASATHEWQAQARLSARPTLLASQRDSPHTSLVRELEREREERRLAEHARDLAISQLERVHARLSEAREEVEAAALRWLEREKLLRERAETAERLLEETVTRKRRGESSRSIGPQRQFLQRQGLASHQWFLDMMQRSEETLQRDHALLSPPPSASKEPQSVPSSVAARVVAAPTDTSQVDAGSDSQEVRSDSQEVRSDSQEVRIAPYSALPQSLMADESLALTLSTIRETDGLETTFGLPDESEVVGEDSESSGWGVEEVLGSTPDGLGPLDMTPDEDDSSVEQAAIEPIASVINRVRAMLRE
jgi:hypothetical protein